MRDLSPAALVKIANNIGNEPVNIIEVEWVRGSGNKISYADRKLDGILGRILEVAPLDNIVNISNNADSQEISVVLDDTDGSIRGIMDTNDIHLRDVWVYQWFEGLDLSDKFLLFKGKINSPVAWNEGARTVSFTIISQLEDQEIGFSPEEGEFEHLPHALVGEPWPMCFGLVQRVKALRLTDSRYGILGDGVGIADFALLMRAEALAALCNYKSGMLGQSDASLAGQSNTALGAYNCQKETERDSFRVFQSEIFPRGTIELEIGKAIFSGHFVGNTNVFTLDNIGGNYKLNHPEWPNFRHFQPTLYAPDDTIELCPGGTVISARNPWLNLWGSAANYKYQCGGECAEKYKIFPSAEYVDIHARRGTIAPAEGWYTEGPTMVQVPDGRVVGDNAGYIYLNPGDTVKLADSEEQKFVVSIVPGTVLRVSAWAEREGQRFLRDIPPDQYTVTTETYGEISAVMVTLPDALSKYDGAGWEDDIFVTFESDIGPNPVDIIEYLIDRYTDFSIDPVSFANAKTRTDIFPANFAIYERKEILAALQEIAFQICCSIYLKNDVFFMQYLPEQMDSVATVTRGDMLIESLELYHTDTEDILTKMVCKWKMSDAQDDPYTTVLRHNVSKYGTHEDEFDYYIFNTDSSVIKSATFWLIRRSNTWKKVHFKTPLTKLNLESLDHIDINLVGDLADVSVRCIIETAQYDSSDRSLIFDCWTPVKAGTMEPYYFAYPADVDAYATFPTDYEIQEGFDGSGYRPNQSATGRLLDIPEPYTISGTTFILGSSPGSACSDMTAVNFGANEACRYREEPEKEVPEDDKGEPMPSDKEYVPPESVRPTEEFPSDANPGPGSPVLTGESMPQPDGYGNDYEGGPGSGLEDDDIRNADGSGGGDPGDLPDPDELDDLGCLFCVRVGMLDPVSHVIPSGEGGYPYEEGWNTGCGWALNGEFIPNAEIYVFDDCAAAASFAEGINADQFGCVGGKAYYGASVGAWGGGSCAGLINCATSGCTPSNDPQMVAARQQDDSPWGDHSDWANSNGYSDGMN